MLLKNKNLYYMLLALAPIQSYDFMPEWLLPLIIVMIVLKLFISLPSIILFPQLITLKFLIIKEYQYKLQPEAAVAILAVAILSKLLQKNETNIRTHYNLGFLWVGSYALFNPDLYYLSYIVLFFSFLFIIYSKDPDIQFSLKNIRFNKKVIFNLLKALPLIILLFIIFPRYQGFLPSAHTASQGKVGYSNKVDNSNISSLSLSTQVVFYAQLNKEIPLEQLYWRGRTLTHTDGYNWSFQDSNKKIVKIKNKLLSDPLIYDIKLELDLNGDLPILEVPIQLLKTDFPTQEIDNEKFYKAYSKGKKIKYTAQSDLNNKLIQADINHDYYLQLPNFKPKTIKAIYNKIKDKSTKQFIKNFEEYIKKEGFEYSLSPGPMLTMQDFIERKIGFCTHFSSLLGVLLRVHKVPARLVSGFQGGSLNQIGNYYTIRSNDAHAWVEYYDQNQWIRVDPTEFISPNRIKFGGDFFNEQAFINRNSNQFKKSINYIASYISNLNYKINLYLDDFDREAQARFAKQFNLTLELFYTLGFLIFALMTSILYKLRKKRKKRLPEEDIIFAKFIRYCKKRKIKITKSDTITEIIKACNELTNSEDIKSFLNTYQNFKYKNTGAIKDIKQKFTKI